MVFDTVPALPLYIVVCAVFILGVYCVGVTHPILVFSLTILIVPLFKTADMTNDKLEA